MGNNAKSLYVSVEASLKKLRTSYIDILYVHYVSSLRHHLRLMTFIFVLQWDWDSGVEEVMDSLHHLVAARKVLYLVSRSALLKSSAKHQV